MLITLELHNFRNADSIDKAIQPFNLSLLQLPRLFPGV
jgi:hypothetical protein